MLENWSTEKFSEKKDFILAIGNLIMLLENEDITNIEKERLIIKEPNGSAMKKVDMVALAATIETLAKQQNLNCPAWIYKDDYYFDTDTYLRPYPAKYRQYLKETSLPAFIDRKLYCGNNCIHKI